LRGNGGEGKPAAQLFGHLRVGHQRRQILRPQREKTLRQIVLFAARLAGLLAHRQHYRASRPSGQAGTTRFHVFDEADRTNRCIVA
jgi:hypothetical protein